MWGRKAGSMSAERAERLLMRIDLSESTLRNILYRAPEPYKERAWRRLQPLNPRAIDLASVLYSGSAKYRVRVANRMIAAGVGFETVLHHATAWIRKKAARVMLARSPSSQELWLIVMTVSEPYRGEAWRRLFKNGTTRETRQWILNRMPKLPRSYQKRAGEIFNSEAEALLAKNPKELIPIREHLSADYQARLRERLFADAAAKHDIFADAPEAMREVLKEKLFRGTPPLEALKQCLREREVPEGFKGQIAAWALGKSLPGREEWFSVIFRYAPEPWKAEAWRAITQDSRARTIIPHLHWVMDDLPEAHRRNYAEWILANVSDESEMERARKLLASLPAIS